jgi:hypothetical protein
MDRVSPRLTTLITLVAEKAVEVQVQDNFIFRSKTQKIDHPIFNSQDSRFALSRNDTAKLLKMKDEETLSVRIQMHDLRAPALRGRCH